MTGDVKSLSGYKHAVERIYEKWPAFLQKRRQRLEQQKRHGIAAEKVAENIVEDLFTEVLDWSVSDLNNQVGYADILLTQLGIKYILIETKRPGALAWHRRAVVVALNQALRYAAEQRVKCVAVSDGVMLYAADIDHGGLSDRVFISLDSEKPPEDLFWLGVHGIYRDMEDAERRRHCPLPEPQEPEPGNSSSAATEGTLLHGKYQLPAQCFAYVGNAGDTATWHLPYLNADGTADLRRLPKAIQAILSNYRGARLSSVPERDIPDVLVRLARAAVANGKMPWQSPKPAAVYVQLEEVLRQLDRLAEISADNEAAG